MIGLATQFLSQVRRDLIIAVRAPSDWLNPLLFFVMVVTLFPLAISPSPIDLQRVAPGALWIAALLSVLLSLDSLFRRDYEDGSLEQFVLGVQPLIIGVMAKLLVYWLLTGVTLTALSPLLSYSLALPTSALPTLVIGLLLGTPVLAVIGGVGAALTVSLRRGGVLLSLLVLPMMVPVLILGVSAVQLAAQGLSARAPLLWLAVLMLSSLTLVPFAIAAALKIAVER